MKLLCNATLALSVLIAASFLTTPVLAGDYKGKEVPSDDLLIKNLNELNKPGFTGRGPSGSVTQILGLHYRPDQNTYRVHYCYKKSNRESTYGKADSDCQDNVTIYRLNTELWIMQFSDRKAWVVLQD